MIARRGSAGQRVREPKRTRTLAELRLPARAEAPRSSIFLWSRAAIWAAALFALLVFEPNRHPRAARWDDPR